MAARINRQEKAELTEKLFNSFKIPSWAGKPQLGLHLDVLKDGKLVQKLMIDEKKCYFFGRNRQLCDFPVDHESCSRVHAALVWHKFVARPFLIDLGSTHGTYIGSSRLEAHKPQQVPIDSEIHFGASSRIHIIREKPQHRQRYLDGGVDSGELGSGVGGGSGGGGGMRDREGNYLGLPQTESELDNLTEFNTAQNRRIASVVASSAAAAAAAAAAAQDSELGDEIGGPTARKRPRGRCVTFADEDDVINPEDVDPTVGRFRNLVYETFIPNPACSGVGSSGKKSVGFDFGHQQQQQLQQLQHQQHYHQSSHAPADDQPTSSASAAAAGGAVDGLSASALSLGAFSAAAKLGLALPNLAPDVDIEPPAPAPIPTLPTSASAAAAAAAAAGGGGGADDGREAAEGGSSGNTPRKKKYAKEAWPGKKPGFLVTG